eukprot:GCRY01006699.1.p1 GENE.GCRY01006699.1~~GCRY01006699.1.p1  ORF type:complete len:186 (-),score=50.26 GCRY01006699.1:191-748(-)
MENLLSAYADDSSSEDETACGITEEKRNSPPPPQTQSAKRPHPSETQNNSSPKRKKLPPPPPPAILDLLPETKVDRPADHDGKVRQFAHVEGNFATHIYIQVGVSPELAAKLQGLFENETVRRFNLKRFSPEELHISLSRTFPLRQLEIKPFLSSLKSALSHSGLYVLLVCRSSCKKDILFELFH